MAILHVIDVKVVGDYILDLTFNDGIRKRVNLKGELYGEIFESLRDPGEFAKARLDGWTVAWPNRADFAPEYLYEMASEIVPAD